MKSGITPYWKFWLLFCVFCGILKVSCSLAVEKNKWLESSQTEPKPFADRRLKDELRCHCNLPLCVTTGYMCKSSAGVCFSEIVDPRDLSKSRHGCVELLSSEKAAACRNLSEPFPQVHDSNRSVLCCRDDLCNFSIDRPRIQLFHSAARNRSNLHGFLEANHHSSEGNLSSGQASSKDLWLKAATIAVPITGGFILVLLVLLAIRILRRDRRRPAGNYSGHWNAGSDFHIRRVWGKSRQVAPQQQLGNRLLWKDVQPMLDKNLVHQPRIVKLANTTNNVYLPTVHTKTWRKEPRGFRTVHNV